MTDSSSDGLYDQMDGLPNLPAEVTTLKVKIAGLMGHGDFFQIFDAAMEDKGFQVVVEGSAGDDVYSVTRSGGGALQLSFDDLKEVLRNKVVTEGWTMGDVELISEE